MFIRNNCYNVALIIAFILILILPILDNFFKISSSIKIDLRENRNLAKFPKYNKRFGALVQKFPEEFDNYYSDNFGFRNIIIWAGRKIFPLSSKNSRYLVGKDGWIYLNDDKMTDDVVGIDRLEYHQIQKAADKLYENWLYSKQNNIKYVFILVPNKQTVYPEFLPEYLYLRYKRKSPFIKTKADQIKEALLNRDKNFPILDLRNHIKINKYNTKNYTLYDKTDTHWNGYGMKVAYEEIHQYLINYAEIKLENINFLIEEQKINKGDLADMSGSYPYYKSTRALLENINFEEIKYSPIKDKVKEISKNIYNHEFKNKDIGLYKKIGHYKSFVQHDSFFETNYLQPFLASLLPGSSIFVNNIKENNMLCKIQKENILYYKPQLLIHQMVERLFVKSCIE